MVVMFNNSTFGVILWGQACIIAFFNPLQETIFDKNTIKQA
jgi:hypothetical protein